jgi:hypothetical protein
MLFHHRLLIKSIFEDHQFPLWNPYTFGGIPEYSNPQFQGFSPFIIFSLVFGEFVGINLSIILSVVLAGLSMYFVTRKLGLSHVGSFFSSVVFMLNGYFWLDVTHHLPKTWSFFLFPLVYYYSIKINWKNSIILGVLFTTFLFNGEPYCLFHAILFSFLLVFFYSFDFKKAKLKNFKMNTRNIFFFILAIIFFAGLSSIKLIGTYEFTKKYDKGYSKYDLTAAHFDFNSFINSLIVKDVEQFSSQPYPFWEYGAYIGIIPLLLGIIGIKDHWKDILIFLIFLALSFGPSSPINLLDILQKLPIYSQLRVPTRYVVVPIFYLCFYCSYTINELERKKLISFATLLLLFVVYDLMTIYDYTHAAFADRREDLPRFKEFKQLRINEIQYMTIIRNYGQINGYEPPCYGDFGTSVIENESLVIGNYSSYELKTNSLRITGVKSPILINMNYNSDFKSDNAIIINRNGIIELIPKYEDVSIYYCPSAFYFGLFMSLITFLGILLFMGKFQLHIRHFIKKVDQL